MNELIAAFPGFTELMEKAVDGARGAQILALIQQRGVNGGGSAILKTLLMQDREHAVALLLGECARRRGAGEEAAREPPRAAAPARTRGVGGRRWRAPRREPCRRSGFPPGEPARGRRPSGLLLGVVRQRPAQQRAHFFLNVDDEFGFAPCLGKSLVVAAELVQF